MYKNAFKLWVLLFIACNLASAQTSIRGVTNTQGIALGRAYAFEKQNGLVAAYRANSGVFMDGSTNVWGWTDMTGNGYDLKQFVASRIPVYHPAFSVLDSLGNNTANPTIFFNGAQALVSDNLAALFTGTLKPITIIAVAVETSGAGTGVMAGFVGVGRTNVTASNIELRKNSASTFIIACNSDTNSGTSSVQLGALVTTTNWVVVTGTYNGTNGMVYLNRTHGVLTTVDHSGVPTTLNQFSVGSTKTNINLYLRFWTGGISELQIYTNDFANTPGGTQLTNIINQVRGRWNLSNPNN